MDNVILKVGDTVMWSGGWGTQAPQAVKVTSIDLCSAPRSKYGIPVPATLWEKKEYLCVGISTGNWAYGSQISPMVS